MSATTLPVVNLQVNVISSSDLTKSNNVILNPEDLRQIGGNVQERNFIRIANRVYKVALENWLKAGSIGMQPHQFNEAYLNAAIYKDNGSDKISVSLFKGEEKQKPLFGVHLEVSVDYHKSEEISHPHIVSASRLKIIANNFLQNNFVSFGQVVPIPFDKGVYNVKVIKMVEGLRDLLKIPRIVENNFFGYIGNKTRLSFRSPEISKVLVIQGTQRNPEALLTFKVTPVATRDVTERKSYPKMIDADSLKKTLIKTLENKPIHVYKLSHIIDKKFGSFIVTLLSVFDPTNVVEANKFSFIIDKEQNVNFFNPSDDITLISGPAKKTSEITVQIFSASQLDEEKEVKTLNLSLLRKALIEDKKGFHLYQWQTIKVEDIEVRVNFVYIDGDHTTNKELYSVQEHFILDEDPIINFIPGAEFSARLLESKTPYSVKKVNFQLSARKRPNRIEIPEELLLDELKKLNKKEIVEGEKIELNIEGYPKIIATVEKTLFFEKVYSDYSILGEITPKTAFSFKSEDDSLRVIPPFPEKMLTHPKEFLEECGVGGLSSECISHLQKVVLTRSKAKDALIAAGVKPPKGIMLSGPPGTGKTNLARHLGNILGIPESNVTLMAGPSIFNKWVGNSEKNVRELFTPALEEFERHGDKSAPFLLIIDEIDAMVGKRSGEQDVRNSVVNQFISEIDGLKQMDNIFVIGITNHVEIIDEAVVRAGRLNPIIEIGYPDLEGREAIFRIHMRQLFEKDQIDKSVDIKELAKKTDKMNGANIEGVIQSAYMDWMLRIAMEDTSKKLKMVDFERAIEKVQSDNKKREMDTPPFGMYG